jgi:superfamily II DNA or RNA helicase
MEFLCFLYCISSIYTDKNGMKKLGLTVHPVHRMSVFNTGDAPGIGLEKRYDGLWQVNAKSTAELHSLEQHLHTHFSSVRQTRAGKNTEWFAVSFQEVEAFLNSQSYVIRQLSIDEVNIIQAKSEYNTAVDMNDFMEEAKLIATAPSVGVSLKEKFFTTFLPGRIPRRIQNELWDIMSRNCEDDTLVDTMFSGIVKWPTGVGKTIAMLLIFVLIKERSVRLGQIYRGLLVTRRNDIFKTISSEFHKLSEFGITMYDGSNGNLSKLSIPSDVHIIVMACPDSLRNEEMGMRRLPDMSHIHYDEVHRITGKLFFDLLKEMLVKWNTKFLTGTSATPKTSDPEQHKKLADLFGNPYRIIHSCDVDEAVQEGWIAIPRFVVKITPKVENNAEAAYSKAMAIAIQSTILMKNKEGTWKFGKCIAYARSVASAKAASEEFSRIMPDAKVYLATDGNRSDGEFVNSLADGSVKVLFACDRYREGSDIKGIEMTCVLIGNTISAYILIQIQGRSLRMDYDRKEGWCLIVCPCEGDETEEQVLERIVLDIFSFLGDSRPLQKKDIVRYIDTYFGEISINGAVFSKKETIDRLQAAYIRREYAKRTPKEKYEVIRALNKELGLTSRDDYNTHAKEHVKYIEDPKSYFKDLWISWYHFLGVDTSTFPQTKSEWSHAWRDLGITSWAEYKQKCLPTLPINPGEMYEDYTNPIKEFEVEEDIVW